MTPVTVAQLIDHGVNDDAAAVLAEQINQRLLSHPPATAWQSMVDQLLAPPPQCSFSLHQFLYTHVYADWDDALGPPPAWSPDAARINSSNLAALMSDLQIASYADLYRWSVENRPSFWQAMVKRLGIKTDRSPRAILDDSDGVALSKWLAGARYNIVDSCFEAPPEKVAIWFERDGDQLTQLTYGQLERLTNRVANGLVAIGLGGADTVAVCLPMTVESVAIYLGLIRAGCVVVSIADSFAPDEIARRIRIAGVVAVFTQDQMHRGGKRLPLYQKIVDALGPSAVVVPEDLDVSVQLRAGDMAWGTFLADSDQFESVRGDPQTHTNILFSSGTTGEPKAIPWTQLTPIKCAADAYLYHNTRMDDILAWPTNLGWMMGPWLIYATLINRAAMALFDGAPTGRSFGQFVQAAKVTMLGVVPSLVRVWRDSACMEGLDWSAIRAFSSTGECSDAGDMLYLMALARYRPIIEYCGGTEIGGGYIAGTVVQPCAPATFTTPALGLALVILDESGREAEEGELFIAGPSVGLSTTLLNRDHHEVYFQGTPKGPSGQVLRRHGDQMQRLGCGYFRAHGRADDTMNLGGIKVSSAEIERTVNEVDIISEAAAIAVSPPNGGPARLVVFAVPTPPAEPSTDELKHAMQKAIRRHLNPLFKLHDVVIVDALPRTASNKVTRRRLRDDYQRGLKSK